MTLSDSTFLRLRRLQTLLGVVPVTAFVALHLATHASALGGPALYHRVAGALEQLPLVEAIEVVAVALPIAAHVILGIWLGNSENASRLERLHDSPVAYATQRLTGSFLAIWVVFHVWGTRFVPEVARREADLFAFVRKQVADPAVFALYLLGIVAVAVHLALGVPAAARAWAPALEPRGLWRARSLARLAAALLLALGLAALLAFVVPRGQPAASDVGALR